MKNLVGTILTIIGIPLLIYIFWKVRKIDTESERRQRELRELYNKNEVSK